MVVGAESSRAAGKFGGKGKGNGEKGKGKGKKGEGKGKKGDGKKGRPGYGSADDDAGAGAAANPLGDLN